jgi:hypothetical protein
MSPKRTSRPPVLPALLALTLAVPLAALLGACRAGGRADAVGSSLAPSETLHGRVRECGQGQCFTFEGVESSLLSFSMVSDDGSISAPVPTMTDPDGKEVDVSPFVLSPLGAATMQVRGVPLRRTGLYRVAVGDPVPGHQIFYRFRHDLSFPPVEGMRVRLNANDPKAVYVSAPRGAQVDVRITPMKGSGVEPDVVAVLDPWGGRALDATMVPPGMPLPMVSHLQDGTLLLRFFAPLPGVYSVMAGAKGCRAGDATVGANVLPPASCTKDVWHGDGPCTGYGVPGQVATTGSLPDQPVAMR